MQHGIMLSLVTPSVYQRTEGDVALVTFPFRDGFVEKSRLKFAKLKRIYGDQISKLIY